MRKRVREHDVARWAASFLDTLSWTATEKRPVPGIGEAEDFADARAAG